MRDLDELIARVDDLIVPDPGTHATTIDGRDLTVLGAHLLSDHVLRPGPQATAGDLDAVHAREHQAGVRDHPLCCLRWDPRAVEVTLRVPHRPATPPERGWLARVIGWVRR